MIQAEQGPENEILWRERKARAEFYLGWNTGNTEKKSEDESGREDKAYVVGLTS